MGAEDLAGIGKIADSEIAKKTYEDGVSPAMRQVGALGEDSLKAIRLFTAPIQLAAAFQERFEKFCERVREKVPEERQQDAPPEVARPVMEAFAKTSDDSPLMGMFEELMAKAIDEDEAQKLSPEFPEIISSLSPLQARLISDLVYESQFTDDAYLKSSRTIVKRIGTNFDFERYGGHLHHLTLVQTLESKHLVSTSNPSVNFKELYPGVELGPDQRFERMSIKLSMFGIWFANSCVPRKRGVA